jgi:hypothetical protein
LKGVREELGRCFSEISRIFLRFHMSK